MSRKYAGEKAFTEQARVRRTWDDSTGYKIVRSWKGSTDQVDAFLSTLPSGSSRYEITDGEDGYSVIEAEYAAAGSSGTDRLQPQPDPITRTWSIVGSDVQASVWSLPWVTAYLRTLNSDQVAKINELMARALSGEKNFSFADPRMEMLYILLACREETFSESRYVLVKREIVTTDSQLTAAHDKVNRMFRYNDLLAAEPTLPAAKLIAAFGLKDYYFQKMTPNSEQLAGGQWELSQQYEVFKDFDPWVYRFSDDTDPDSAQPKDLTPSRLQTTQPPE